MKTELSNAMAVAGDKAQYDIRAKRLLAQKGAEEKFFLGSGCEINLNTPVGNLKAFTEAGRKYGKK